MSDYEIPEDWWTEEFHTDLPQDLQFWRTAPPPTVVDDDFEEVVVEHSFEEGGVAISVYQLVTAYRRYQDSLRVERHALTDHLVEVGEFRLHRPPDEDDHVPIPRGEFAEVSALEYNFVRGYVINTSAQFWRGMIPDWRRVQEQQALINYFFNLETGSDAFWDLTFRYIPGLRPEVEAFVRQTWLR